MQQTRQIFVSILSATSDQEYYVEYILYCTVLYFTISDRVDASSFSNDYLLSSLS